MGDPRAMQAQLPPFRQATLSIDAQAAKRIAVIFGIYLLIPWPWDWLPLVGDLVDLVSFLIAYSAIKAAAPRDGTEAGQ
jgi:hypothetical protein